MKSLRVHFRLILAAILLLVVSGALPHTSLAQTVSVSPGDLSFGIPTRTPAPLTSTEIVTVNVTGTGQASLSAFSITGGSHAADFTFNGNTCTTPQTAPTTCAIGVQFTSTQPAGVLETATLNFTSSTQPAPLTVPLNGAYGAIKLFDSININPSLISYTTWLQNPPTAGYTVQGTNLNLSCPGNITAILSSTPDGLSNVFQDNTIAFSNTVNGVTTTTTNICTAGDPGFDGYTGFPAGSTNCFVSSYESVAPNYLGQNPDLATYPLSGGSLGSFNATYGVSPFSIAGLLAPGGEGNQQQSVTVQLQDAGGQLGASTLHLVTSCSPAGITPGGTVTGNAISPTDPSTLTQTYALDSSPNQNISITDSTTQNPPPAGTVPSVTDIGIPQQLFYQLVSGTSAAPSVCMRMSGELDSLGNPMCKGFLVQCTVNGTTSGANCDPANPSTTRALYDAAQFASPDAPVNGFNFLYGPVGTPAADACAFVLPGITGAACASNTGAGMLMGSDNWLCAPGQNVPCTPLEPNTATSITPPTYAATNCQLSGSVTGDLCPLNTLTQLKGAADLAPGGTTPGKNSIFIPVANMPLPSTSISNSSFQLNGWVHVPNVASLTFTANPATYSPQAINPPANTFAPAAAYAVTYGITAANSPIPDTTYPVAGDNTIFNPTATANFVAPLCSASTTSSFTTSPVILGSQPDGIYNLHYFTTDCALTEELLFNPQGSQLTDPTANWASFHYVTYGVDTVTPTFTCNPPNSGIWYNTNQSAPCTVTEQNYIVGVSGSGFSPAVSGIQGSSSESVSVATTVLSGSVNSAAATTPLQACDLAGNCVAVSAGPFKIDLQAPTISALTLSSPGPYYVNGPPVTISYSCSDGLGSGIASCSGVETLPGGSTVSVASGGVLNMATAGSYTLTVTAVDLAGNPATSLVTFTVSTAASADVTVGDIPFTISISRGKTGYYYPWVLNLSSSSASNVVTTSTFTVPNKVLNGSIGAVYNVVGCTRFGCSSGSKNGAPCSVTTTVGSSTTTAVATCNIGTLASISKLQGVVITASVPVLSTATVGTKFSSVTVVTSANDPNSKNNSVTQNYSVAK